MTVSHASGDPHQDEKSVREFFDQWHIYRKVVEQNYLHHREAFSEIGRALKEIREPFSFIDLGAGDAEWTSRALAGLPLKSYEAVDLSAVALDCAKKNLADMSCPKRFTQANFFEYVKSATAVWDVAFIGLSLHHLPLKDKRGFFPEMRRIISKGGRFLFYEPILETNDTRESMLTRWWETSVVNTWTTLNAEEMQKVHDHVFSSDYPEMIENYSQLAKEGGFRDARVLYTSPGRFYAVFECMAD